LVELAHHNYPGERLIARRNPVVGKKRVNVRRELLAATAVALEKLQGRVSKGKLKTSNDIGMAPGIIIGQHKMSKHLKLAIGEGVFAYRVNEASVAAEAEATLDGIYIFRTSVPATAMSAQAAVLAYKDLSKAEQAFKGSKSFDLPVRPVHHHLDNRVRAHFLIAMLAYYVKWHLQRAWASLTFTDEEAKPADRDPAKPASARGPPKPRLGATSSRTAAGRTHSRRCWAVWPPSRAARTITPPRKTLPSQSPRNPTPSRPRHSNY